MEEDIAHLGLFEDDAILLDTGALELAALDHPDLPLEPYHQIIETIVDRLEVEGRTATSAGQRAAVLAQVIGHEFGFAGDRDSYDDQANADLIRVIDRRRGLPISLSIVYVAAARRLGWSADALNTPGHVLVRVGSATEPVLIDPFDGGTVVGAAQLAALLAQMLGPAASPTADHLLPMSNRAVLVRLLMNQATRAEAVGKRERALTLYQRITRVAPATVHAWWDKARLELAQGEIGHARASLSAMLEVTRELGLRTHIFAALDALARPSS